MAMADEAARVLADKLGGQGLDGTALLVLDGEGAVVVDASGARVASGGEDADVTMTAAPEVFQAILAGEMGATGAFMSGKLKVDGDMGLAMRLGSLLG